MAHAFAAEDGQTGDLVDGIQLVDRDAVIDEGGDAVLHTQGAGDHGAHVGGVLVLGSVFELPDHVVVDLVSAGADGRQQAAAGDDAGEALQRHAVVFQGLDDQLLAELVLLGHVLKGGQLLGGVDDGLGKEGRLVLKDRDLGGGGAGVDD